MDEETRARLEAAGFRETTVQELFGLTPEENEHIETRLALARLLKQLRQELHLTQKMMAVRIHSDQANVSRAEKNDPTISLEWMLKAIYALGADRERVAKAICS
ncbi:MAG TPA: helix-turn-helix domain-containing protein [Chthonomonadaceae bacterium]|nr:helix-turn-helix domain-containing protein [Chthonomonadaceae bacterium]